MKAELDAQECQFLITAASLYLQSLAARINAQLTEQTQQQPGNAVGLQQPPRRTPEQPRDTVD